MSCPTPRTRRCCRLICVTALCGLLLGCSDSSDEDGSAPAAPEAVRLEVQPQRLSIALGSDAALMITALSVEGQPVAVTPEIISSDATRIAVDSGRLRALAAGPATITVRSGTLQVTVEAQVLPAAIDTASRIAEALRDGRITADEALKYRVLAAYQDPRLPMEFLGTQAPPHDSLLMEEVARRLPNMPPAEAAVVQPFTVPPIYADSWYASQRGSSQAVPQASGRAHRADYQRPGACSQVVSTGWRSIDTANFRIWYEEGRSGNSTDAQSARSLAGSIEAVRTRMVSQLGMRPPPPDTALPCNGGDGRFDIYIVEPNFRYYVETGSAPSWKDLAGDYGVTVGDSTPSGSSVHILLNANKIRGIGTRSPCSGANCWLMGTVAHEFFHAVQHAYNYDTLEAHWLQEATADLAIDLVDSSNNLEQAEWPGFQDKQDTPLWFPNRSTNGTSPQLQQNHANKVYGASVFFYYLTKVHGTAILGDIFNGLEGGNTSLVALDRAIPGGLAKAWHDFAIKLYNRTPVTSDPASLKGWDNYAREISLALGGHHPTPQVINLGAEPSKVYTAEVNLGMLSMQVHRFDFGTDNHTSSLAFFNGWGFQASETAAGFRDESQSPPKSAVAGSMLFVEELSAQSSRGRGLWAVIKTRDGKQRIEDWTHRPMGLLCRDFNGDVAQGKPSENVDFLTLIFDSGYFDSGDPQTDTDPATVEIDRRKRKALDRPFTLVASRAPCAGYEGVATSEWTATSTSPPAQLTGRATLTGKFTPDLSSLITEQVDAALRRTFYMNQLNHRWTEGSLTWRLSGTYCGAPVNQVRVDRPQTSDPRILVWPALLPGGAHVDAAASGTQRLAWILPPCNGVTRDTPEQPIFDFNANLAEGKFTPFVDEFGSLNVVDQHLTTSSPTFGTVDITANACFKRVKTGFPPAPSCP